MIISAVLHIRYVTTILGRYSGTSIIVLGSSIGMVIGGSTYLPT